MDPGSTATGGGGNGAQTGSGDGTGTGSGTPTPEPTPMPTMPPAQSGTLALAIDKATDTIRLNETKSFTLTLTPANGFAGGVTLALDNPPAGVTAKFTPGAIDITGAAPVTATVAVTVASNMATPGASMPLSIKATSGTISASANLGATIPAELLVEIPNGVALGTAAAPNTAAFGTYGLPVIQVAAGTKITWVNRDGINHEIHSDGTFGIAHEGGQLLANGANSYTQTFKNTGAPGTQGVFKFRCHLHPQMTGEILINN